LELRVKARGTELIANKPHNFILIDRNQMIVTLN
jgi:hypothetical protein